MDEFFKDRQIEKETFAIINYFKLLKQLETAELDTYDSHYLPEVTFCLIGGEESFNKLLLDYKEGNIDVFSNTIGDLFDKLEENINYMSSITFCKSKLVDKAINDYKLINKFYSNVYSVNGNQNIAAIYDIMGLPLPDDMFNQVLEIKSNVKKIGER